MPLFTSTVFLTLLTIIISIIGIIVAIIIARITYQRKTLVFRISPTTLIDKRNDTKQNHSIVVDGKSSNNLISTKIQFINVGNQTIKREDFSETLPLVITTTGHIFWPDGGYKVATRDPDSFQLYKRSEEDNTIIIDFNYIKPRVPFSIEIWHEGNLSVQGEMQSGELKPDSSRTLDRILTLVVGILLFVYFVIILFTGISAYVSPEFTTTKELGFLIIYSCVAFAVGGSAFVLMLSDNNIISFNLPHRKHNKKAQDK